ncbi:hypothetical protein PENTCL1PPCAC_12984, partial [Pristionchus entomophagus]
MVTKQQQTVIDQLNHNVSLLRQHQTRHDHVSGRRKVMDRLKEEVQHLNNRWENVQIQLAERLRVTEQALQIQMVYRGEYDRQMVGLDRKEHSISKLEKPEKLRVGQIHHPLNYCNNMYCALQERTAAIENMNREGGKFIREAKGYDGRLRQYSDQIRIIHGRDIEREFKRSHPQPKNGAQVFTVALSPI